MNAPASYDFIVVGAGAAGKARPSTPIASFPLSANRQHEHRVQLFDIAIEGDVAARPASDHEFPQVGACRASDERVAFEHVDCPDDVLYAGDGIRRFVLEQVPRYAVEVVTDYRGELALS